MNEELLKVIQQCENDMEELLDYIKSSGEYVDEVTHYTSEEGLNATVKRGVNEVKEAVIAKVYVANSLYITLLRCIEELKNDSYLNAGV